MHNINPEVYLEAMAQLEEVTENGSLSTSIGCCYAILRACEDLDGERAYVDYFHKWFEQPHFAAWFFSFEDGDSRSSLLTYPERYNRRLWALAFMYAIASDEYPLPDSLTALAVPDAPAAPAQQEPTSPAT